MNGAGAAVSAPSALLLVVARHEAPPPRRRRSIIGAAQRRAPTAARRVPSPPPDMKVAAAVPSPLPAGPGGALKAMRPGEAARCGPGPGAVAAEQAAAALLYDMKGCYSRLRALVPTLPRHRRVSKVELLQHVIDYIWDLQLALQPGPPRPPAAAEPPEVSAALPNPSRPPSHVPILPALLPVFLRLCPVLLCQPRSH